MADMVDNVHNLEKSGMTREQAEAVAKVIRGSIAEALEPVIRNMATKAEVAELRNEIAASDKHTTLAVAFGCAAIVAAIIFS